MKLLRHQQAVQAEWRLRAGAAWQDSGLVFTNKLGGHLMPHTVYQNYKKVVASIGRPDARFHDLRHSYAVAAIRGGDDIKDRPGQHGPRHRRLYPGCLRPRHRPDEAGQRRPDGEVHPERFPAGKGKHKGKPRLKKRRKPLEPYSPKGSRVRVAGFEPHGLLDPNQARYQASPHPDSQLYYYIDSLPVCQEEYEAVPGKYTDTTSKVDREGCAMYERRTRAAGRTGGTAGGGPGARRGRGTRGGGRDRMLLAQLCVCLALFLTVFLGRGLFPGRMAQLGEELRGMIAADFDFRGGAGQPGRVSGEGDTVLSDLGEFCVQVFDPQETEAEPAALLTPPAAPAVLASELSFLSGRPDALERTEHYTRGETLGVTLTAAPAPEEPAEQEAVQPQVLPAGAVIQVSDYDGAGPAGQLHHGPAVSGGAGGPWPPSPAG